MSWNQSPINSDNCQGHAEEHGRRKICGRGNSLDDAQAQAERLAQNAGIEPPVPHLDTFRFPQGVNGNVAPPSFRG